MIRSRRLRRSLPDEEWLERFVAGESLRSLSRELGVPHTTLGRRLGRAETKLQLREARRRHQAKRRALREQRIEEKGAEKELRRRARADARRDRVHAAWRQSAKPIRLSEELAWLDEREGPRGLPSRERWSINDELADRAVSAGGGIKEVIDATTLNTRLGVFESIDPQIVVRALAHERRSQAGRVVPVDGLRRLEPDASLFRRRAAGEPLRELAADYGVSHTTLLRYFRRPTVAKALCSARGELERPSRRRPTRVKGGSALPTELVDRITAMRCPKHRFPASLKRQTGPDGEISLVASCCCLEAQQELLRRLQIDYGLQPEGPVLVTIGES